MAYAFVVAWRQLVKQRLRLLVALGGVAFAVVLMLMQIGFQGALFDSGTRLHRLVRADLVMLHRDSDSLSLVQPFPREAVYQALGHPGVVSVAPVYLGNSFWKNPVDHSVRNIFMLGFDPDDEVVDLAAVNDQREALKHPERVLFDARSRQEFGPIAAWFAAGREVRTEIGGRRAEVAGLFEFGATFVADGNVVTSDEGFLRLTGRDPGLVQLGLVRLAPEAEAEAVRGELLAQLPASVKLLTRAAWIADEIRFWQTNTAIGFIFGFGVVMGLIVGGVIVYQILYADVADHLAEYATLKAMGFTNGFLAMVVVSEALILSLVGFAPGVLLSAGLYELCERATFMTMTLGADTAGFVFALTVVMCCASSVLAVRKVQTADPADVF